MISEYNNRKNAARNGKNKRLQRTRYGKSEQVGRSRPRQVDNSKLFDRILTPQKISDQEIGGSTVSLTDTLTLS